mmetsp:Transcript_16627/g.31447  ORF Transcript_16627/g.31447 Transcript_16627/m.31447 type:complete len:285 (-) Transcript_16627:308-1162(-)
MLRSCQRLWTTLDASSGLLARLRMMWALSSHPITDVSISGGRPSHEFVDNFLEGATFARTAVAEGSAPRRALMPGLAERLEAMHAPTAVAAGADHNPPRICGVSVEEFRHPEERRIVHKLRGFDSFDEDDDVDGLSERLRDFKRRAEDAADEIMGLGPRQLREPSVIGSVPLPLEFWPGGERWIELRVFFPATSASAETLGAKGLSNQVDDRKDEDGSWPGFRWVQEWDESSELEAAGGEVWTFIGQVQKRGGGAEGSGAGSAGPEWKLAHISYGSEHEAEAHI